MKQNNNFFTKFLYDYLPLIVFFIAFKLSKNPNPLIDATIYMLIVTIFAIIISLIFKQEIPKIAIFSAIILSIFGSLTILLQNEIFIKIKPTIVNLIFSVILFYGYFSQKPLLSYLLGGQIQISKNSWLILSFRWALFFMFLALLNEIIWRNFTTDFWVKFKVFGMMPITLVFTISQMPFIINQIKQESKVKVKAD